MKIRYGFVSNSSSASFLVALDNDFAEQFREEFYASGQDGLYATIDVDGKDELLKDIDRQITRRWQSLFNTIKNEFDTLEKLKAEKEEIKNYDPEYSLMEICYHGCRHKTVKIVEEYLKKNRLQVIKEV